MSLFNRHPDHDERNDSTRPSLTLHSTASGTVAYDAVREQVKVYMVVFGALLLFTFISLGVWALNLPTGVAITLALSIAVIKASLIGCFFMHLLWERVAIFLLLGLVAIHGTGMVLGTYFTEYENAAIQVEHGGSYIDNGFERTTSQLVE